MLRWRICRVICRRCRFQKSESRRGDRDRRRPACHHQRQSARSGRSPRWRPPERDDLDQRADAAAAEFRDIIVKSSGGNFVRLSDVAEVEDSVRNSRSIAWFNKQPAVAPGRRYR